MLWHIPFRSSIQTQKIRTYIQFVYDLYVYILSQKIGGDLTLCAYYNEKLPHHNSEFITPIKRKLIKNLQF